MFRTHTYTVTVGSVPRRSYRSMQEGLPEVSISGCFTSCLLLGLLHADRRASGTAQVGMPRRGSSQVCKMNQAAKQPSKMNVA